jgi:hypothetical protein
VVIIAVLFINLLLLNKIDNLNDRIQNLSNDYRNLQVQVNSISGNVQNTLNQFTREQSWITPIQVNEQKTKFENEQGTAVLNWQIKDWREGSQVFFHYRLTAGEEFQEVPAESKGAGLFEVSLPLTINIEPYWSLSVSKTVGLTTAKSESAVRVESAAMRAETDQALSYYVSLKTPDGLKSSEISSMDVGYLARAKYEPIEGHVRIKDNQYDISIFKVGSGREDNKYASIRVKFYNGDNIIAEKLLEEQQNPQYFARYEAGTQKISRLVVEVQYIGGKTSRKEINL